MTANAERNERSTSGRLNDVDFDELLREVLDRMHGVLDEQARLRLLLDAVVTMAADLSLDGVLSRIVSIASTLVDAEYAALGVLGVGPERRLRTFIHHGMTRHQVAEIGDLPTGHGLLGLIIDRPEPLRLHDIAEHPASYGFPENHPPMNSFLGVPVRIRGQVFGNLYLTEKRGGGDFTEVDESIVIALAAAAGRSDRECPPLRGGRPARVLAGGHRRGDRAALTRRCGRGCAPDRRRPRARGCWRGRGLDRGRQRPVQAQAACGLRVRHRRRAVGGGASGAISGQRGDREGRADRGGEHRSRSACHRLHGRGGLAAAGAGDYRPAGRGGAT